MRSLIFASAIMLPAGAAADSPSVIMPKAPPPHVQVSAAVPSAATEAAASSTAFAAPKEAKVINPVPEDCPSLAARAAEKRGRTLTPDRLTELPPGEAFHAVYRVDSNGCPDPVLVGYQREDDR